MTKEDFKNWWYHEGSQPPYKHHDCEEHCMRMCEIAWSNGAFKEREACAKMVEDSWMAFSRAPNSRLDITPFPELTYVAKAIRARGQE